MLHCVLVQVECRPLCSVGWYRNGSYIRTTDPRYTVSQTRCHHYLHTIYTHYIYTLSKHYLRTIYSLAPAPATNTADLVRSSLSFTLAQWPLGRLDQDIDNRHTGQPGQGNIGNVHNMGKIISYRNGFNRTKVCANWAVAGHV